MWRAGLYLSDYMLENVKNFKDKTVLELAAGTGLLSLVTSSDQIRAKQVICTGAHLHLKNFLAMYTVIVKVLLLSLLCGS